MATVEFTQGDEPSIEMLTALDYSTATEQTMRFTKTDATQLEITTGITHQGVQADGRFKATFIPTAADSATFLAGKGLNFAITGKFSTMPITTTFAEQLNVRPLDVSDAKEKGF